MSNGRRRPTAILAADAFLELILEKLEAWDDQVAQIASDVAKTESHVKKILKHLEDEGKAGTPLARAETAVEKARRKKGK